MVGESTREVWSNDVTDAGLYLKVFEFLFVFGGGVLSGLPGGACNLGFPHFCNDIFIFYMSI